LGLSSIKVELRSSSITFLYEGMRKELTSIDDEKKQKAGARRGGGSVTLTPSSTFLKSDFKLPFGPRVTAVIQLLWLDFPTIEEMSFL